VSGIIVCAFTKGENVHLTDFSRFPFGEGAATTGRNPTTGARRLIPAEKGVKFAAGYAFEDAVDGSWRNDGIEPAAYADLQQGIADIVAATRAAASRSVNAVITARYWAIGGLIVEFEQGAARTIYHGGAYPAVKRRPVKAAQRQLSRTLAQMRAFYWRGPLIRKCRRYRFPQGNRIPV
jgi:hypothetical protein